MRGSGCEAAEWAQAGVRPGVESALRFEITSQSPGGPLCSVQNPDPQPSAPLCPSGSLGGAERRGAGGSFELILGSSNATSPSVPRGQGYSPVTVTRCMVIPGEPWFSPFSQ